MAARTIKTGIGTYKAPDGQWTHGMLGEEVDVHEGDLERFDRLNEIQVVEVEAPAVFSQDDVDSAVAAAADAQKAELAEARKAIEDEAAAVAKQLEELNAAKAEFEKAQAAAKTAVPKTAAKQS